MARDVEGWLRCTLGKKAPDKFSEAALRCAHLLEDWVGLHHLAHQQLGKVDWTNQHCIELRLYGHFSSFDNHGLTALVFLAHDHAVRIEISACNMQYMTLRLHPRVRTGDCGMTRHPTIEEALERYRKAFPTPKVPA